MKPRPNLPAAPSTSTPAASDAPAVAQIKAWLVGISPMVWRRVLVPAACTLRELRGVLKIAMGWDRIHLYQFSLRATRYGSLQLSASSCLMSVFPCLLSFNQSLLFDAENRS